MSKETKTTTAKKSVKEVKSVFETLSAINVNDKIEKKNGLTYLSWAWAWGIVKGLYPTASYKVMKFVRPDGTESPYFFDPDLGYLVMTEVTIEGDTIPMQLPVLDGANKAMKNAPYSYKTKYGEKYVAKASMFDINTSIMRCLTKNIAMHGLGFYIYAGEDIPEQEKAQTPVKTPPVKQTTPKPSDNKVVEKKPLYKSDPKYGEIIEGIKSGKFNVDQILKTRTMTKTIEAELRSYEDVISK